MVRHELTFNRNIHFQHYSGVIMDTMASLITSLTSVYSTVYPGAYQRKHQKLRVTGLCAGNSPGPVNSPHKWPVTRKMFPFDDVIMIIYHIDGLVQERRNSIANAWELRLSCTKTSISFVFIARTHGCVRNGIEIHETGTGLHNR